MKKSELKRVLKEIFKLYEKDPALVYRNGACDAIAAIARHVFGDDDFLYKKTEEKKEAD